MESKTERYFSGRLVSKRLLKFGIIVLISLTCLSSAEILAQVQVRESPSTGYRTRIRNYIDSMRIVDTHEHFFNPDLIKNSFLLDFMLLFDSHNYYDLVSAGMNPNSFLLLTGDSLTPEQKWEFIKPYWDKSANTGFNRISLIAADRLLGFDDINESTVGPMSSKIKNLYQTDWFQNVLENKCRFDYVIQDGARMDSKYKKIRYVSRFSPWLIIRSKYQIDSIAIMQVREIKTLEDFVKSLEDKFIQEVKKGIVAVKISMAYTRSLDIVNTRPEIARKVFHSVMSNGEAEMKSYTDAKPLQDYMVYRLLELAGKYHLPVIFHTGIQNGNGNYLANSNPLLLAHLFMEFPDIDFSLFHGSYPYGGELATLAKTYPNVYIDMSWLYAISPSYSERYLHEWLETVPAGKIMAFGGDYNNVENTYGELIVAKQIITRVLTEMVRQRYMSEERAIKTAKMILHDNAVEFYHLLQD